MKRMLCFLLACGILLVCCMPAVVIAAPVGQRNSNVGEVRLNIETYLAGKNQPTHPSVVVFEEPWNGFRYWMSYSPYPYANGEEENPCIAVSNDLYDWSVPYGLVNPIADNEETGCHELKDPHLLYRQDLDRLEVWYLGRVSENLGGNNYDLILFRKFSEDGVHWSDYEVMDSVNYLSPSVYWNGEKYQMWSIGYDMWNTTGTFVYQESVDGMSWTEPVPCVIDGQKSELDIWHGSVYVQNGTCHFVYIGMSEKQNVYYCSSNDGIVFGQKQVIVQNDGVWDFFYRPALVMEQGEVACIYGVVNNANEWYLSMSTGSDISDMQGISAGDTERMHEMPDDVTDTRSLRFRVGKLTSIFERFFRVKLLGIVVFELILMLFIKKLSTSKLFVGTALLANVALTAVHLFLRMKPVDGMEFVGASVAFLALNGVSFVALSYVYLLRNFINQREGRK